MLDRKARRFLQQGQPLDLPAREFEVLWELMSPAGRVVSKRTLSQKLSEFDEALGDNARESLHEAGKRYLHDEAQLVAERDDVAKFAADIQRLRIDVQRLQARVAKLA